MWKADTFCLTADCFSEQFYGKLEFCQSLLTTTSVILCVKAKWLEGMAWIFPTASSNIFLKITHLWKFNLDFFLTKTESDTKNSNSKFLQKSWSPFILILDNWINSQNLKYLLRQIWKENLLSLNILKILAHNLLYQKHSKSNIYSLKKW